MASGFSVLRSRASGNESGNASANGRRCSRTFARCTGGEKLTFLFPEMRALGHPPPWAWSSVSNLGLPQRENFAVACDVMIDVVLADNHSRSESHLMLRKDPEIKNLLIAVRQDGRRGVLLFQQNARLEPERGRGLARMNRSRRLEPRLPARRGALHPVVGLRE